MCLGISCNSREAYAASGFNDPRTLTTVIRALSNHSSDYRATTKLFHAVTKQYSRAWQAMGGSQLQTQDLLLLLFGFKNTSNSKRDISMCLKHLVDSVLQNATERDFKATTGDDSHDFNGYLSAYALSNALIGLRGMSNSSETVTSEGMIAVDHILSMFADALNALRDYDVAEDDKYVFTAKHLSVALQGLQGLSCGASHDSGYASPPLSFSPSSSTSSSSSSSSSATGMTSPVPPVVLLLDALHATLQHQQLMSHSTTDPSSQRLDLVQGMSLAQCSRALYGLLRIHHQASSSTATLKSNLLTRSKEVLTEKYGEDATQMHKRDIVNISELLELQRVLHLYVFMYKDDALPVGVSEATSVSAREKKGRLFHDNVCKMSTWLNEYISQSAIIVKENETSDNSTLERRFRKAILAAITSPDFMNATEVADRDSNPYEKVALSSNTNIQGFDVDMIVTFSKDGMEDFVYNLEIDGPHHKKPHKEAFFRLRDAVLLKSGFVHRVRRVSLFKDNDPRRVQVINKSARDAVVRSELQLMLAAVLGDTSTSTS